MSSILSPILLHRLLERLTPPVIILLKRGVGFMHQLLDRMLILHFDMRRRLSAFAPGVLSEALLRTARDGREPFLVED